MTCLAEELLLGKRVRLEYDDARWDAMKRPRLLACLFVGDLFVNAEMVRRGMASANVRPPNVKFIGNKHSKRFHKPDCKHAIGMHPKKRKP